MQTHIEIDDKSLNAPLFSIHIRQKEGETTLASITTSTPVHGLNIKITIEDTIMFDGKITDTYPIDEHLFRTDAYQPFDNVHEACFELVDKKELTFGDQNHPSDLLESKPFIFHFSRTQKRITLSHIIEAPKNYKPKDIISIVCEKKPSYRINVQLHAQWMYQRRFVFDLFDMIHTHFGGPIHTLTPHHIRCSFTNMAGHTILKQSIKPTSYKTIRIDDRFVQCASLSGTLKIMSHIEQKIEETVAFTMGDGPKETQLNLFVPNLESYNEPTFFETQSGKKWILHAINYTKNKLLALNRCYHIRLCVPFTKDLFDIDLDYGIELENIGLGKIFSYAIYNDSTGYMAILDIRILHGSPIKDPSIVFEAQEPEDEKPFVEAIGVEHSATDQIEALTKGAPKVLPTHLLIRLRNLKTDRHLKRFLGQSG